MRAPTPQRAVRFPAFFGAAQDRRPNVGPLETDVPFTLGTHLSGGDALIRPITVLIAAMALSRPGIPFPEAKRYATALNEIAAQNKFDPLLAVAMIHYETHWFPQLVSDDGEDHGLGQIRARFIGACREDADPLWGPSPACQQVKLSLLDGVENIRHMGAVIRANMEFCGNRLGKKKTEHWLAGYQGYVDPVKHTYCAPGPKTTRVIEYYDGLLAKYYPKPKPKPQPKTSPTKSSAPQKVGPVKQTPKTSNSETDRLAKSGTVSKKQRAEKPKMMPGASRQTRTGKGRTGRAASHK